MKNTVDKQAESRHASELDYSEILGSKLAQARCQPVAKASFDSLSAGNPIPPVVASSFPVDVTNQPPSAAKYDGFAPTAASEETDDEPAGDASTEIVLELGADYNGALDFVGDVDYLAINLSAGVYYEVTVTPFGDNAQTITFANLVDASGRAVRSGRRTETLEGVETKTFVIAYDTDTTVYLSLNDGSHFGNVTDYNVSIRALTDDEPDGAANSLRTLTLDETATGVIEVPTDTDAFAITLQAGTPYRISVDAATAGSVAPIARDFLEVRAVYDADGNQVEFTSPGDGFNYFVPDTTGIYYVAAGIDEFWQQIGGYSITVSTVDDDEPTQNFATQASFDFGGTYSGVVDYAGDVDVVALQLEGGFLYTINLSTSGTWINFNSVTDFEGNNLAAYNPFSDTDNNFRNVYVAETTTVYITVSGFAGDVTDYTISASIAVETEGTSLADTLQGGNASDVIEGQGGNDLIFGRGGDDVIRGGDRTDTLHGNEGNDTLSGGSGYDRLIGGPGNDVFLYENSSGQDVIVDFESNDKIDLSALDIGINSYEELQPFITETESGHVLISLGAGSIGILNIRADELSAGSFIFATTPDSEQPDPADPADPSDPADPAEPVDSDASQALDGTSGNDVLRGGGGDDTIFGGAGNDLLRGDEGDDWIDGGTGDDQIFAGPNDAGNDIFGGGAGDDVVGGGAGNDVIVGGAVGDDVTFDNAGPAGSDTLFGGAGNDIVIAGAYNPGASASFNIGEGNNIIFAGPGSDQVFGDGGADLIGGGPDSDGIFAGGGNDTVYGGSGQGNDTLEGAFGEDLLFGSGGDDYITGNEGDDRVFGGGGADQLDGGAGDDSVYGGAGDDTLTGGDGADVFFFANNHGIDVISDFDPSADILFLRNTVTDFTNASAVRDSATETTIGGQSGLLIDTGGGNSILLIGARLSDLTDSAVSI